MQFLQNMDHQVIALVIGVIMMIGSFATMSSPNATKFDHDFALLLLIAGVICLGFGFGFIDLSQLKHLWPGDE